MSILIIFGGSVLFILLVALLGRSITWAFEAPNGPSAFIRWAMMGSLFASIIVGIVLFVALLRSR